MSAYSPPLEGRDPQRTLLLDFNERVIPPGRRVTDAIIEYLNSDRLNLYPSYGTITEPLARYAGVEPAQVMITNGSDHGIEIIFRAICSAGETAIIVEPSFDIYRQIAGVEGLKIASLSYTDDYRFPTAGVIEALNSSSGPAVKIVVIPNPNNPTGTSVPPAEIAEILRAGPQTAVLVDECYFEYTGLSAKEYIETYPNLFITRTFSKTWGMPSIRFGYILSSRDNIADLTKVRGPYDVNQLSVVAARAALEDSSYMRSYVDEILTVSKPLFEQFLSRRKIPYWPSSANFYLVMFEQAEAVDRRLQSAGIRVRPKRDNHGKLGLRITLGQRNHTERLIAELTSILESI